MELEEVGQEDVAEAYFATTEGAQNSSSSSITSLAQDISTVSIPGSFGIRPKAAHNSIFAAWIMHTFGQDNLRSHGGIVDVAGGAGGLSYEFSVRYGIDCTVVDPREITLNSILRRRMKKVTEKRDAGEYFHEKMPEYLKTGLDDGFVLDIVWKAVRDENKLSLPFNHIQERFELPLQPGAPLELAIQSTGIILGMHPDSAAADIVDAALHYNKPFAILPCCVFPELFSDRFIGSKPVRSYEDLVEYIKAKDSSIRELQLPFVGKNKVLFKLV